MSSSVELLARLFWIIGARPSVRAILKPWW